MAYCHIDTCEIDNVKIEMDKLKTSDAGELCGYYSNLIWENHVFSFSVTKISGY